MEDDNRVSISLNPGGEVDHNMRPKVGAAIASSEAYDKSLVSGTHVPTPFAYVHETQMLSAKAKWQAELESIIAEVHFSGEKQITDQDSRRIEVLDRIATLDKEERD
jgi:hypothetical protein